MQKQTSVCITFVLWPNTKQRRKNTSLEENILNVNSGDGREKAEERARRRNVREDVKE